MPDSRPTYSGENEAKRGFWTSYSWVFRLFASATSVLAGLIAFGFFSEAALYEMAGLPRLSADPEYLAEAGARGLVSSLAAIGIHGTIVLLLLLAVAYLCWSVHEHPYPSRWLRSPGLLVAAQSLVLAALTTLVIVLVSVAGLGTARGRDQVERQVLVKVGELRDRSDWTPALERNVTEEMRMAPTPVAHWYLRLGELLRHGPPPWPRDVESEATPPSLGFPLRPTDTLRRQARSFYGWLVVAAIALPGIVILLWRWRTWAAAQVPLLLFRDTLRQRLPTWWKRRYSTAELPLDPELRLPSLQGGLRHQRWQALYQSSAGLIEPVLGGLALIAIALLPSAHGVLAIESIGLQPVLVRLASSTDTACGIGTVSIQDNVQEDGFLESPSWTDADDADEVLPAKWLKPREGELLPASGPCSCSSSDLAALEAEIEKFRRAWQEVTLKRVSELSNYVEARQSYQAATDQLVAKALALRCAEALRRLWTLLPEPGELSAQPQVAEYFVNRFSEAITRDGFALYGNVLAPPRGDDSDHITLFTRLGTDRWILREVERTEASEIIVLPNERNNRVAETITAIRTSAIPDRLDQLVLFPSAYTLQETLDLLETGSLPHPAQARLVTIIGAIGRITGPETSPQRERAIRVLAKIAEEGLSDVAAASAKPSIDLAGGAVTSLATIGGPFAARQLASVLQIVADSSGRPLSVDQLEAVPTVVTAAGFLASDLRESLRTYKDGRDPTCVRFETPDGPSLSSQCRSAEVAALRQLVSFLGVAASQTENSLNIRTASCTGLGLSLEPGAQNRAFGIGVDAVGKGLDELAGSCLIHTPSRLSEPQLRWLRAIARGSRVLPAGSGNAPDHVTITTGHSESEASTAEAFPDPVPDDLRNVALVEMQEAGLWSEGDLVFDLLRTTHEGDLLKTVAKVIGDVDGRYSIRHIQTCIEDVDVSDSVRRRCVLAAGLIHRVEDGDYGFSKRVLAPQLASVGAPERLEAGQERYFPEEACVAAAALSARGGNDARRLLDIHWSTCLPLLLGIASDPGDVEGALVQAIATGSFSNELQEAPSVSDFEAIRSLGRNNSALAGADLPNTIEHPGGYDNWSSDETQDPSLISLDARRAISAGDLPSFAGKADELARIGSERDLEWLSVLAETANDLFGSTALGALLAADPTRWAPRAAELYTTAEAGHRVLVAAKFLEDGPPEENSQRLLGCLNSSPLRERCAIGLALLASSWRGSPEVVSQLDALAGASQAACRAHIELALRNDQDPSEIASGCPMVGQELISAPDQRARWALHLRALIEVLRSEGVSADSSQAINLEAEQLDQYIELLENLSSISS